jgi:hypothetical protein
MFTTKWRGRVWPFSKNLETSTRRRRARQRPVAFNTAAEILECRELLTGTPYLAWVQQPGNAIAGHGLSSFTLDVMISTTTKLGVQIQVDTAYTGLYTLSANGPGVLVGPANSSFYPNAPLDVVAVDIVKGVGIYESSWNLAALDVAGTYTLSATAPPDPITGAPGVAESAVSAKFNVTPDTATDHLVFVNPPTPGIAALPTNITVAVEDQFGNIDKSVSNVQLTLVETAGTPATATLTNGEATFDNVIFTAAGSDELIAFGTGGPNGFLFGDTVITVLPL